MIRDGRRDSEQRRPKFFYFSDDGDLMAGGYDNWKQLFLEQCAAGILQIWAEPFTVLRVPKPFNLRTDPYERADTTSNTYCDWVTVDQVMDKLLAGIASG